MQNPKSGSHNWVTIQVVVLGLLVNFVQLRQQGGQVLLDGYVCYVICRILKVANDIILDVTIITVAIVRPESICNLKL